MDAFLTDLYGAAVGIVLAAAVLSPAFVSNARAARREARALEAPQHTEETAA